MDSKEIMLAINEIANTPGKNDKLALLSEYMKDATFVTVMIATYNPFITYGIKPKRRTLESVNRRFNQGTFELLSKLASRMLTGDAAKFAVSEELVELDVDSSELLWRIINKDMKAGFSESSLNKVKKDLIPEFPYMRCSLPKDASFESWPWATGVFSQIKADGMFFNGNVESEFASLCSRQGQPFPKEGFEGVTNQLHSMFISSVIADEAYKEGIQTHGELLVENEKGEVLHRKIGNGLINKLIKGTPLPEGYKLVAELWDIIPIGCVVKKGEFKVPYLNRLRTLNAAVGWLKARRESVVSVIETRVVRSYEEAMAHYYDARRRKKEGTVAKKITMVWKDGTSKDQVKLKQEVPVELEVYGFEEGKEGAKTTHTFGSLKCKSDDGLLKVDVGTGFSDDLRREINENRSDWLGAIITANANEIMYASRGKLDHSLFLPVFVERRFDKTKADTFDQIVKQFENAVTGEAT